MILAVCLGITDDEGEGTVGFPEFGFWVGCVKEVVDFVCRVGGWVMLQKLVECGGDVGNAWGNVSWVF